MAQKGFSKECMHCDKMFECKGKPKEVDKCVNFKPRNKELNKYK